MADYATALGARLRADATVAGLVGTRVYWTNRPQNSLLPAIRLNGVVDPRPQHLKGYHGARVTLVQADCMAATKDASMQVAEAVIAALAQPATFGGVKFGRTSVEAVRPDAGEDTPSGYVHLTSVDLLVEHRLA